MLAIYSEADARNVERGWCSLYRARLMLAMYSETDARCVERG